MNFTINDLCNIEKGYLYFNYTSDPTTVLYYKFYFNSYQNKLLKRKDLEKFGFKIKENYFIFEDKELDIKISFIKKDFNSYQLQRIYFNNLKNTIIALQIDMESLNFHIMEDLKNAIIYKQEQIKEIQKNLDLMKEQVDELPLEFA